MKSKDKSAVFYAMERLSGNPDVVFAEPDYLYDLHILPNDPLYKFLWGMENIRAPLAWNYTTGSPDVVVGVLDSGVDSTHPDLSANLLFPGGRFMDSRDETGHGTHVAGTVGAVGNNLTGVTGVCWNVGLINLKIGNVFIDLAAAIEAIHYATLHTIPILNNSWGGRRNSAALRLAIEQYDGLFIASAGNNGTNNDLLPMFPASYNLDNIISVAALSPDNTLAPFSNFGIRSVHIAAPGTRVLSTDLYGEYSYMNGTSMAAPHVAGAAALLKSYRTGLTALDMKYIILSSAERLPDLSDKVATGGILNANAMFQTADRLGERALS
ncbi:MAG: S8 family serine peptidase [Firmicutes bacterium]|nr:S8 family serine peptidase [Bacillota bacterium]